MKRSKHFSALRLSLCAAFIIGSTLLTGCNNDGTYSAGNPSDTTTEGNAIIEDNNGTDIGESNNENNGGEITGDENGGIADNTGGAISGGETNEIGDGTSAPLQKDPDESDVASLSAFPLSAISANASNAEPHSFDRMDNTKIGWGLGKTVDESNRPTDATGAQSKYGDLCADFIGEENAVYLTFDEGYENGLTGKILDILAEKNVKATFFVTYDYCKSAPELVRRMLDEGHTVGNHSYTHPSFPELSAAEVADELKKLHNYVAEEFGYEMTLCRFPKGEFSERSLAVAKSMGYRSVFWSFAYADWDVNNQCDTGKAYDKITAATHPGEICLLHAVSETNAQILGSVIDYWQGQGYDVKAFGA